MHPVESFTYYTAALVPALLSAHPLVFLLTKACAVLSLTLSLSLAIVRAGVVYRIPRSLLFLPGQHDGTLAALWGHDGFAYPGSGTTTAAVSQLCGGFLSLNPEVARCVLY